MPSPTHVRPFDDSTEWEFVRPTGSEPAAAGVEGGANLEADPLEEEVEEGTEPRSLPNPGVHPEPSAKGTNRTTSHTGAGAMRASRDAAKRMATQTHQGKMTADTASHNWARTTGSSERTRAPREGQGEKKEHHHHHPREHGKTPLSLSCGRGCARYCMGTAYLQRVPTLWQSKR